MLVPLTASMRIFVATHDFDGLGVRFRWNGVQQPMSATTNRRQFLALTSTALVGLSMARPWRLAAQGAVAANDKLNIGIIGVAGQGGFSIDQLKDIANLAALCDVDETRLAAAKRQFPAARTYRDFRRLVDQSDLDAIVVATPDHTHAVAAMAAMNSGRHVYCEKPLTRTVSETRAVTEAARRFGRVTQIGTQIHAGSNYRRVVELIRSGAIGEVSEVHVWVAATYGGHDLPQDRPPVPKDLDWDLWLGPVAERPYHPQFAPFAWRNWWHFGGGALADFGCHFMDLPFWALDLSHPISIEAEGPPVHAESTPPWLIVRYQFPDRITAGERWKALNLTWYHGGKYPEQLLTPERYRDWKSGVLFIGSKGMLLADYGRHVLLPEKQFEGFVRPAPFIKDSRGHHREWVEAIRLGGTTTCRFEYSGPLTETALLGNVAYRVGRKIEWDYARMKAINCPEADALVQHQYRSGWSL
jgi:predicted dehydrogenase